jgi:hypothetical protein
MGYEDRPEQSLLRQFGGLNTHDGELGLPIGDSPDMDNVDLHPVGSIQKRLGMAALTSPTGKVKIDAVMRLVQPDEATPRGWVYVVADNTIYRVPEPGTWTWQTPTHASSYTLVTQKVYGRQQARYNSSTTDVAGTEYPAVLYLPRSNGTPLIALGASSATGDIISLRAGSYGDGVRGTPDVISTYGVTGYPSEWGSNHWPRFMRLIALGRARGCTHGASPTTSRRSPTRKWTCRGTTCGARLTSQATRRSRSSTAGSTTRGAATATRSRPSWTCSPTPSSSSATSR